ncbi:hypothetical protein EPN42_05650 [bacterium]|nr:MAG: hypothetical protein EPN42_05650 [bacterium]
MTQAINNRVRSALLSNDSGRPLDGTVNGGNINSGDLCYWTGNGVASFGASVTFNAALVALIAKLLGVSRDTNPLTAGGISNSIETVGVDKVGEFAFNTTAADTYVFDTEVTIGADAQTITVAPTGPTMVGSSASGAGGTWSAAAHVVTASFLTALGETTVGASQSVTVAAGNNIVTEAATVPAWALGVCYYVDGLFAGFSANGAATTLAGPNANPRIAPTENALAIGRVRLPVGTTSVAGGAGVAVNVALEAKYPHSSLQ